MYVLGNSPGGASSIAIAEDLLSYFWGWDALFLATRTELEEFNQLEENQIELILTLGKLEKLMKSMEN